MKMEAFVELADTFHLPVVHLVDQPGIVIGVEAERAATIRHSARALAAVYQAQVPWCSIILRRVFGVGGAAHSDHTRVAFRAAWPSGDWGSLPLEGGIEAAYRAELDAAPDRARLRAEIDERMNAIRSPFRTAGAFGVEEIIDPRDTRPFLCEFATWPPRCAARAPSAGPTAADPTFIECWTSECFVRGSPARNTPMEERRRIGQAVRISGRPWVTTTVCSNWAVRWPGVTSVQPSAASSAHVAPVDRNGSMASTRPSHRRVRSRGSS